MFLDFENHWGPWIASPTLRFPRSRSHHATQGRRAKKPQGQGTLGRWTIGKPKVTRDPGGRGWDLDYEFALYVKPWKNQHFHTTNHLPLSRTWFDTFWKYLKRSPVQFPSLNGPSCTISIHWRMLASKKCLKLRNCEYVRILIGLRTLYAVSCPVAPSGTPPKSTGCQTFTPTSPSDVHGMPKMHAKEQCGPINT